MTPIWALLLARAIEGYLAAGVLFAIPFAFAGADRIDPAAHGSTKGFRATIVPGAIALWPLLLARWIRGVKTPLERNAHRDAARRKATP